MALILACCVHVSCVCLPPLVSDTLLVTNSIDGSTPAPGLAAVATFANNYNNALSQYTLALPNTQKHLACPSKHLETIGLPLLGHACWPFQTHLQGSSLLLLSRLLLMLRCHSQLTHTRTHMHAPAPAHAHLLTLTHLQGPCLLLLSRLLLFQLRQKRSPAGLGSGFLCASS